MKQFYPTYTPLYIGYIKITLFPPPPPLRRSGTFSTDGFQDGYGELDRAGLGIQGAVRTKARENKNSLATKTIPDYGVNEIVGETRTQT